MRIFLPSISAASRCFSTLLLGIAGFALTPSASAQSQMFPSKPLAAGVSAYVLAPSEGVDATPDGWQHRVGASWGNSAIGDEAYSATQKGATLPQVFTGLPMADYVVSVLIRGQGQARLSGQERWATLNSQDPNKWQWFTLGQLSATDTIRLELRGDGMFFYGGILTEGSAMPVIPVGPVVNRIHSGKAVTVALLGDSVTENWLGTGGGASSFEAGFAGRIKAWLERVSGQTVDYLTHRTPESWEGIDRKAQPLELPTATVDGKAVYDSRIELDPAASVHLINLGKGGAAADWGFTRMAELIVEGDWFDGVLEKDQRKPSARFGLARYEPDLVFVNFGTNDVNRAHEDWTAEDYLFHMKVLATTLQHRFGAAVVLATPHKWTQGTHLPPARQQALVDALRDYCRSTGLAIADVYAQYGDDPGDGIHPGDEGHRRIADAYIQALSAEPN